ncbi:MAG TPA: hypothetical protein VG477_13650 [Thermoanaerobaculia bacterium]|nr:hypothetical protein [Thermoanaerobaculia bacterium]
MRSYRNVLIGTALSALVVAGTLWAEDARRTLPLIKVDQKAAAAPGGVSQAIIDVIDFYDSSDIEKSYHARITDPNVPWQEKCRLAIRHGRLHLLSSDIQGSRLGGTREVATSTLRVRLLCPDQVADFEIPANFEVHTAPHPEEIRDMSFATDMYSIEGKGVDVGPFASIRVTGGTANGFSSPGITTLKSAGDGVYVVDSHFNVGYRFEFEGAKGGPLEGLSGKIESSIEMKAVGK